MFRPTTLIEYTGPVVAHSYPVEALGVVALESLAEPLTFRPCCIDFAQPIPSAIDLVNSTHYSIISIGGHIMAIDVPFVLWHKELKTWKFLKK